MGQHSFHADEVLLRCMRLVVNESHWMRTSLLCEPELNVLMPPCTLDNFSSVQTAALFKAKSTMEHMWVPSIENLLMQELAKLPENAAEHPSAASVASSRVPNFLKQTHLRMQADLWQLVYSSLAAYLALLRGFAALTRLAELEARAGRHLAATRTAALTSISDAEIDSLVEAPVICVATTTELPRYGGFSHGKPWSLQDEISKTLGDRFSCMQ